MSTAATNARTGAATVALATLAVAAMVVAAPLLAVAALVMIAVSFVRPSVQRTLRCWVAAVMALLRDAVTATALAVLWLVSPLLGGPSSKRLAGAHTLLLGWFVRGKLRDRAVLLDAPLVAETIPDDLVLDHRPPADRRPIVVLARTSGEADALVLPHVVVNIYRRRTLLVPPSLVGKPVVGRSALAIALGRLSRSGLGQPGADGAVLVLCAPDAPDLGHEVWSVPGADLLFIAHRGWPGELRVAQWSVQTDEVPSEPDTASGWLSAHLEVVDGWLCCEGPVD